MLETYLMMKKIQIFLIIKLVRDLHKLISETKNRSKRWSITMVPLDVDPHISLFLTSVQAFADQRLSKHISLIHINLCFAKSNISKINNKSELKANIP